MWKVLAGLVVGLAIGLAIVPAYGAVTKTNELSKHQIEYAVLKHYGGSYRAADCERRQFPTDRFDCTLVAAGYPMNRAETIIVRSKRITYVGQPQWTQ